MGHSAPRNERAYEIWQRLLKHRIVFIGAAIDDYMSSLIVSQLLLLDKESPKKPIHVYINSEGGYVDASLAIFDTFKALSSSVQTYCVGKSAGTAALLVAAGSKGDRYGLNNSRYLLTAIGTPDPDRAAEAQRMDEKFSGLLGEATGQSLERVRQAMKEETWLSAEEACRFGLIDEIVTTIP